MAEVIRSITGGLYDRTRPSTATSQLDDDSGKTAPCDSRRVCFEAYPLSGLPPAFPIVSFHFRIIRRRIDNYEAGHCDRNKTKATVEYILGKQSPCPQASSLCLLFLEDGFSPSFMAGWIAGLSIAPIARAVSSYFPQRAGSVAASCFRFVMTAFPT
ncbi:hypothetical protein [Rhizobium mayense]|uniref:hypothetical protein n=1 Tax=Rhizobium mayense TaxID=1312184 RepID=UPI00398C7EC2